VDLFDRSVKKDLRGLVGHYRERRMRMAATVGQVPLAATDMLDVVGHLPRTSEVTVVFSEYWQMEYKKVKSSDVWEMLDKLEKVPAEPLQWSFESKEPAKAQAQGGGKWGKGPVEGGGRCKEASARAARGSHPEPSGLTCHNSGQRGQVLRECTQVGPTCYRCGKIGHIATDCPNDSRYSSPASRSRSRPRAPRSRSTPREPARVSNGDAPRGKVLTAKDCVLVTQAQPQLPSAAAQITTLTMMATALSRTETTVPLARRRTLWRPRKLRAARARSRFARSTAILDTGSTHNIAPISHLRKLEPHSASVNCANGSVSELTARRAVRRDHRRLQPEHDDADCLRCVGKR
jgi:hypothetical protein